MRFGPLDVIPILNWTETDTALALMLGWRPARTSISAGIGWDDQVPLSAVPGWYDHTTPGGNRVRGAIWCGLYMQTTTDGAGIMSAREPRKVRLFLVRHANDNWTWGAERDDEGEDWAMGGGLVASTLDNALHELGALLVSLADRPKPDPKKVVPFAPYIPEK